ncbi:MAG: glycosyltransferase family 39 protein [Verrucomicrobiota bacterium]
MPQVDLTPLRASLLTVFLWAALYLPYLGTPEIRGEESRRILPARTMIETGDWIVPRIGGEEYYSKPPLINWSIGALFALTGMQNEWLARLPSVLWILAFALTAALVLRPRLGPWPSVMVGLFFLTTVGMLDKGRMAEIEPMYISQTGIAYFLWARFWSEGQGWKAYTIPWIFLGLGMLAKGPVHLFFFYLAVGSTLWIARRRVELILPAHGVGVAILLSLFLPWTLANLQQVEVAEETSAAWWGQLRTRFNYHSINWQDWVELPFRMVFNFFPWTILLILLWRTPVRGDDQEGEGESMAGRWGMVIAGAKIALILGLICFSLSPGIRPRYSMPLFGMAALVTADLWRRREITDALRKGVETWWGRLNQWSLGALVGFALVAVIVVGVAIEELSWWMGIPGVLAAGALWVTRKHWQAQPLLVQNALMIAAAQLVLYQFVGPWETARGLYRPVAREVKSLTPEEERPLVFLSPGHLRFLFYLKRSYKEVTAVKELPREDGYYLAIHEGRLGAMQTVLREIEARELGRVDGGRWKLVFFAVE